MIDIDFDVEKELTDKEIRKIFIKYMKKADEGIDKKVEELYKREFKIKENKLLDIKKLKGN